MLGTIIGMKGIVVSQMDEIPALMLVGRTGHKQRNIQVMEERNIIKKNKVGRI